ncbi:MAG: hypothetical protein K9M07_06880 [Simkaniaceae bacterium]|nr:hypothetical protein [Simkaniaceae bacterium]
MKKMFLSICSVALLHSLGYSQDAAGNYNLINKQNMFIADVTADSMNTQSSDSTNTDAFAKAGFFVGGEFLYWKLDIPGQDYAITRDFPAETYSPDARSALAGDLQTIGWSYKPGGRVTVGYREGRDLWEITGDYTYYKTSKNNSSSQPSGIYGNYVGTMPEVTSGSSLVSGSSSSTFKYQIADLFLGRAINVTPYINLRVKAGAKGAFMHQDWSVFYTANNASTSSHQNNFHYNAFGLFGGFDARWKIWGGLDIFQTLDFAGVYGKYKYFLFTRDDSVEPGIFDKLTNNDNRTIFTTRLLAGLGWQWSWDWFGIRLQLGYELNTWFNLAQSYREIGADVSLRSLTYSNLSLEGLNAGLTLNF